MEELTLIYDILPVNNYQGNNSATQFDFDFYIENESQLNVFLFDENNIKYKLAYNKDYSINEFKNINGSYITFPVDGSNFNILSNNEKLSLELTLPISQETQYNNSSLLNLATLEYSLDYLTRLIQIYSRKIDLCVRVDECSEISPNELMEDLNNKAQSTKEYCATALSIQNDVNSKFASISNINEEINANYEKFQKIDDLENLKANKTDVDGQWVYKIVQLFSNREFAGLEAFTVDISDYLPNDGYDYEVFLTCLGITGKAVGDSIHVMCSTGSSAGSNFTAFFGQIRNQVANQSQIVQSSHTLPVSANDKAITISQGNNIKCTINCSIQGYRRLGKNV